MAYALSSDVRTGSAPGRTAFAITPDDSNDLSIYAKVLYIGVSGDVVLIPIDSAGAGTSVTFKGHPVGYLLCGSRRVLATGTTATNILGIN